MKRCIVKSGIIFVYNIQQEAVNDDSGKQIYPRSGDNHTVYLNQVITNPNIIIGDYTMYHDFRKDPTLFEQNNVPYHYPINHEINSSLGNFCSIACGTRFYSTVPTIP